MVTEIKWSNITINEQLRTGLGVVGFLSLCLCLLAVNVPTVAAQTPVPPAGESDADLAIQQLRIQVLPEFDNPRVLVVVQGRLAASDITFPLPVTFRVPRGAQINQMAVMDVSTGATTSQSFDAQPDPDDSRWSLVSYALDNAHFFYEYYYDPIEGETNKQFTYAFSSLQPVMDFSLEVQQPLAATNFTLDPPPTIARFDEAFGFTYHQFNIGSITADDEVTVAVSYTKTDPDPSLSREQVMGMQGSVDPPEMPAAAETSHATSSTVPTWTFVMLGAVILVSIGAFAWYRSQPAAVSPVTVAPRASKAHESSEFCTQCGATLKTNARFCHVCGTPCKGNLE